MSQPSIIMTPERIESYSEPRNRERLEKLLDIFNKNHLDLDFFLANDLLQLLIDTDHKGYIEAAQKSRQILEKNNV
jgi:hypothetical protein